MKKIKTALLISALVISPAFFVSGCGNATYDVALILSNSNAQSYKDHGYNELCYNAISDYCTQNSHTFNYYQPKEETVNGYSNEIEDAISKGAELIILPGSNFTDTVKAVAPKHPNTSFVLIDNEVKGIYNVSNVLFSEEEAGYLAGYAIAKEGITSAGFIGGGGISGETYYTVDPVVRFGMGYIQGLSDGIGASGLIKVTYGYAYSFQANERLQELMGVWYDSGIDSIFTCGGSITDSGIAAAKTRYEKSVIGVDTNQGVLDECVITSAMKEVYSAVSLQLKEYYEGNFSGGTTTKYSAKDNGIGLPLDNNYFRFSKFTKTDYYEVFNRLKNDQIIFNIDEEKGMTEAGMLEYAGTFLNLNFTWSTIRR